MSSLRQSAKGMACLVRIPGVCSFDESTTVLAHIRCKNTGVGMKSHDLHGAYCCARCHDVLDGRVKQGDFSKAELRLMHLEGMVRSQLSMLAHGYISINGRG